MFRAYDRVFIASCIDFRVLCAADSDMGTRRGDDAFSYVTHVIVMRFALAPTMPPTTSWAYWRQGDTSIDLIATKKHKRFFTTETASNSDIFSVEKGQGLGIIGGQLKIKN